MSTGFRPRMLAKSLEKTHPTRCFVFPNLRLGCIKWNRGSGVSFRGTLRWCEYSIWATNPRKIHRKDPPDPGVCHSSPFVGQSPPLRRTFRQLFQPACMVYAFVEMFAPMGEIVQQMGMSGSTRLVLVDVLYQACATPPHSLDNLPH